MNQVARAAAQRLCSETVQSHADFGMSASSTGVQPGGLSFKTPRAIGRRARCPASSSSTGFLEHNVLDLDPDRPAVSGTP